MSDRLETTLPKPEAKLARARNQVVEFFKDVVGNPPDIWGIIRGEGTIRGEKGKVGSPVARMVEIMKKVDMGEPVTEDDFGRMALYTWYARDAVQKFMTLSRHKILERPEAEIPLGKDKKSWFERVGIVAVGIVPALGGFLGRKVKPEATAEKEARWARKEKPAEQFNVPEFLKDEARQAYNQLDSANTERDPAILAKSLAAKNFIEKFILAKYTERYGVVGEKGTFSKDSVRRNVTYLARQQMEKEARERGETPTEGALREATQAYLDRVGPDGTKFIDQEMRRAKDVYNAWIKLGQDEHFVLQGFRTICQMFNINPDSVVAADGVLREFNPQNPFEPGTEIKLIKTKRLSDGAVVEIPIDRASIFDLLDNEVEKMRLRVLEAHIKTLIAKSGPKGEGGYVTYQEGNKIRLHSWSASEAATEIAASGYRDRLLNVKNQIDEEALSNLVNDILVFGGDQSRQRIHNLVAFSTLFHNADLHYGIWRKFTERAADANWDEWGSKDRLRSYVELDTDFAQAVKKYTTGEFSQMGPPSPDSFNGQLLKARQGGNFRRIEDLELAEKRALQLMKLFLAPYKGWEKSDPAAYQLFNYIFAPGSQDPNRQEISNPVMAGFAECLKKGEAVFLEGKNAVTGEAEIIFKSAKNSPGFFVLTIDPKETKTAARFISDTKNYFQGKEIALTGAEAAAGTTLIDKARAIKGSDLTPEEIAEVSKEQRYVVEVNINADDTVGSPEYILFDSLSKEKQQAFLADRTKYQKPGWMMPLEEAAGPMWTQAFNMGDVMNGVLATDWEVENLQRRIVHLGRGEMYDPQNPYHWAEIVKHFYGLRTKIGGEVGSRTWGLEFKDEKDFRGQELDPLNADHLVFIASKVEGITVEKWKQNWQASHSNTEFSGGLDENGNATKDTREVLQNLMEPRNWKIAGCENGLYVDLTKQVWLDRLQSMQFLFWRFEQARKTFSTILPALRGLAPSEITIGGARYENGVYHGMTPAKYYELMRGVYGNLTWWEGHAAGQVAIERINQQVDEDLREEIPFRHVDHDVLFKMFEEQRVWAEARLREDEKRQVNMERYFFYGKEITPTAKEIRSCKEVLKKVAAGETLSVWEQNLAIVLQQAQTANGSALTNKEIIQAILPLKAEQIKTRHIELTTTQELLRRVQAGQTISAVEEIIVNAVQQAQTAKGSALTEQEIVDVLVLLKTREGRTLLTVTERAEALTVHNRLYGQDVIFTDEEKHKEMTLLGKAKMMKGDHKRAELEWAVDLFIMRRLSSIPGTSINTIWKATIEEHLFEKEVPLVDEHDLEMITKDPRHLFAIRPVRFMRPNDPRFSAHRERFLGGLYDSYSRYTVNLVNLDANLNRKTQWPQLTGSQASVNQGLYFNKVVDNIGYDNALELGHQFAGKIDDLRRAYGDRVSQGIWVDVDGKHEGVPDGWQRFCRNYLELDVADRIIIEIAGGDKLRRQLAREFFDDTERGMLFTFFTDMSSPKVMGMAAYEQMYREVWTPFANLQYDESGNPKGEYARPPSWVRPFPLLTFTRSYAEYNKEGRLITKTKQETRQIVWDTATVISDHATSRNLSIEALELWIEKGKVERDPTKSNAQNAAYYNMTQAQWVELTNRGDEFEVAVEGVRVDDYIKTYNARVKEFNKIVKNQESVEEITRADVIRRIKEGKFFKVTLGEITYVGARQKAADVISSDPVFNETIKFVELSPKRRRLINDTLEFIGIGILAPEEKDLPTEIPDYAIDTLMDYAAKNFSETELEELRKWYVKEAEEKEKPHFTRTLLVNTKKYLDPGQNPQGLSLFVFDVFGLNIGDQQQYYTADGALDISRIQKIVPAIGRVMQAPGFVFQNQRISQERNGKYEAARILRHRHRAGGLGDKGKQELSAFHDSMARQEVEEIARLSPWHPILNKEEYKNDSCKYGKEKIREIEKHMLLDYGINMRAQPAEVKAMYAQWLGSDWENPVGAEELKEKIFNYDVYEHTEQLKYKDKYGKPLSFPSGLVRLIGGAVHADKQLEGVSGFLLKWVDPNGDGFKVCMGVSMLTNGAIGMFNTVSILVEIPGVIARTIEVAGELQLPAILNAVGGGLGSAAITFGTQVFLGSLAWFVIIGPISNLYAQKIWYPRELKKSSATLSVEQYYGGWVDRIETE